MWCRQANGASTTRAPISSTSEALGTASRRERFWTRSVLRWDVSPVSERLRRPAVSELRQLHVHRVSGDCFFPALVVARAGTTTSLDRRELCLLLLVVLEVRVSPAGCQLVFVGLWVVARACGGS